MGLPSAFPESSFLSAFLHVCEQQVGCDQDSGGALSATLLYVVPKEWSRTGKKVQGTSFKCHNLSPSPERESGPSIPKNDKCHSKLAVLTLGLLVFPMILTENLEVGEQLYIIANPEMAARV